MNDNSELREIFLNTSKPSKFYTGEVIEIKLDELIEIVEKLIAKHTQKARIDQVHKDLGGLPLTMPIKSVRTRNTAFKLYAVKFFNSKIKERRERQLATLKSNKGGK